MRLCLGLALVLACGGGGPDEPPGWPPLESLREVSEASLLADMVDPEIVMRAPNPPYVAFMASSFDRRSEGASPGSDAWFANIDSGHFLGQDGAESILFDETGPGAITRIWSANPRGTIRIYLDGSDTPAIEQDLRELLHGNVEPWVTPYGFVASFGYNFYYPIPYANGCRVTVEVPDGHRLFYQINARRYVDERTVVQSFGSNDVSAQRDATAQVLRDGYVASGTTVMGDLADGVNLTGPGVIREIRLGASLDEDALRQTLLSINFDGKETVRVPLGDFFGVGPGLVDAASLMATLAGTELSMRWPMPFASSATLSASSSVPIEVDWESREFTDDTLLFHAHYRSPEDIDTVASNGDPTPSDWNIADLEGRGLMVGMLLNVANESTIWWGEGDEKVFVDEERFPSFFGTGTEDFFGYAWCSTQIFDEAFIGQTRARNSDNAGNVSLYRWMLNDAIPFTRSLRFDLETLHGPDPDGAPHQTTYDAVFYYYGTADTEERGPAIGELRVPRPPVGPDEGAPRICGGGFIPPDP